MTAFRLPTTWAFVSCLVLCKAAFLVQPEAAKGSLAQTFVDYVQHYRRPYREGSKEYADRYDIFRQRVAKAAAHNSRPGRLWTAGINILSDRSDVELAQLRGLRGQMSSLPSQSYKATQAKSFLQQTQKHVADGEFAKWNNLPSLLKVKDQARCGSCWAVATITVLEAHADIHDKKRTFSAQELVSCVPNDQHCGGDGGCEGATVELALNYALVHGLSTETEWPYSGQDLICRNHQDHPDFLDQHTAHQLLLAENGIHSEQESLDAIVRPGKHAAPANSPSRDFGLLGWQRLPQNSYDGLIHALVKYGPVAISVDAGKWNDYEGGVFDDCGDPSRNDTIVDHAATLVGYGTDQNHSVNYYLIQNSWTKEWGENGRLRLLRRDDEEHHCTRDSKPEVGTGCENGEKEVEVCGTCGVLYDSVVPHFRPHEEVSWDVPV